MSNGYTIKSDGLPHIDKDPNDVRNYTLNFTVWAQAAGVSSITSATVSATTGITLVGVPFVDGLKVTQRLSGGSSGSSYSLTFRPVFSDGQTIDRTIVIDVKDL